MRVTLTKEEAQEMLIKAVNDKFTGYAFNKIEFSSYNYHAFCEISVHPEFKQAEQEAA